MGKQQHIVHPHQFKDAARFAIWPQTGKSLKPLPMLTLHVPPYYEVSHDTYPNFEHNLPAHLPMTTLFNYLSIRDCAPRGHPSVQQLISLVQQVHRIEKENMV
mmetsp:Transcript_46556/g.86491  ORF Transcript_46556/g.86491 Transcript_46556/m.86491 type:complete len:103 (-) Transcript_46556:1458-1766(-)